MRKTLITLALVLASASAMAQVPAVLNFSGRLSTSIGDITGTRTITINLWDDPSSTDAGHQLWTQTFTVQVQKGRFHLLLGTDPSNPLPLDRFNGENLYIGVSVDNGQEITPRMQVVSVPYALKAGDALRLGGHAPDAFALANQACTVGQVMTGVDITGKPVCVQNTDTLGELSCANGKVAKWNGTAWKCADDNNTTYKAGDGLVLTGVTFSLAPAYLDGSAYDLRFVNEGEANSISSDMIQDGTIVNADISNNADISPSKINGGSFQNKGYTFPGKLTVKGGLDMSGKQINNVGDPVAGQDAATKSYVDKTVSSTINNTPGIKTGVKKYTVVLALRQADHCPPGYHVEQVSSLAGSNNWLYINIFAKGLFMGGVNSPSYGQEYLYAALQSTEGIKNICWKTYNSSSGHPHTSVFMMAGGSQDICPKGYFYIPASDTKGNNGYGYLMANETGMYIGYVHSWAHNSTQYDDNGGFLWRDWTSHINTICFRVFGVDEDPDTSKGVYPVFIGDQTEGECPSDFSKKTTAALDGSDTWLYISMTDNASVIGGLYQWGHGGNNYLYAQLNATNSPYLCWKYFQRDGNPFTQIRTLNSGSCPTGYYSFNAANLKGNNGNWYLEESGHGLYMGWVNSWGDADYSQGYIQHNFTTQVKKACLHIDGVK